MPDTSCLPSTWAKISNRTIVGWRFCMILGEEGGRILTPKAFASRRFNISFAGYCEMPQRLTRADRNIEVIFAYCHTAEKSDRFHCVDELRPISQVVSKMCFGRSGRYSNGKIDQADHFRR